MSVKQVIIIRKDLKLRRGKECVQASHASMQFLVKRLEPKEQMGRVMVYYEPSLSREEFQWLESGTKKICLQVDSEEELLDIVQKSKDAGLLTHLIIDAGLTEFHGVPTKTCCAIGPDDSDKIDTVTGHLKLY